MIGLLVGLAGCGVAWVALEVFAWVLNRRYADPRPGYITGRKR